MLKFLVDHNVPRSVGIFLKKEHHDVKLVGNINPEMSDLEVVKLAMKEARIVVSNDKDFLLLAIQYDTVDMVLFDFISQQADIRIRALKKILSQLKKPFGVVVLQD